ncbi:anosmin-1b [Amia ocellicauda]|uniref:anosmin-1b n=1 Tax=Amia ocellicauda TaxID=2972642 RepID=UPI003463D32C|nr:KALM protein [Amia calva]
MNRMLLCQMSLLLWGSILGSAVARRSVAEDGEISEMINSARCTSRCLALHITLLKHTQNNDILGWCENHRRCSQCLQPCKELWETRRSVYHKTCKKHHECVTSYEFLMSIQAQKQGDCPPPQKASGFAAACVEGCSEDRECSGHRKCCSNGCGHTCQSPASQFKGVPLKPRKDMTFQEAADGQVEVSWMSKFNVSVEPVLYVLQRRSNYGIHPSEDEATPWQNVVMTPEERAVLEDMRPHRWYQFRVSAVNVHGTRGFTTPSKHFHSSRDPVPPETPRNMRRGNFTMRGDGCVGVRVSWDVPQEEDLPVHHYKVYWSSQAPPRRVGLADQKENSKSTEGVAPEVDLEGLQPNTVYLVQVQAIAYWAQKRLKSRKAQLVLTTPPTDSPGSPAQGRPTGEVSNELPGSPTVPSLLRIDAAAPHYHSNQLQVKVFWKKSHEESLKDSSTYLLTWFPEVCSRNITKTERKATVQGTHFVITGLEFACKYSVSVKPVSTTGPGSEVVTSVTTPPCSSVKGRGAKSLSCGREDRHLLARKIRLRPERLSAAFQTVNGSVWGHFQWQLSLTPPPSLAGFQVSWLQVSSRASAAPDTVISQTQILPPDQLSLSVEHLQADSVYKVQVQLLTPTGGGPAIVKMFHTPPLNASPL